MQQADDNNEDRVCPVPVIPSGIGSANNQLGVSSTKAKVLSYSNKDTDSELSDNESTRSRMIPRKKRTNRSRGISVPLSNERETLWVPDIPIESGLRKQMYSHLCSTQFWPDESTLKAEATLYRRFIGLASWIGGTQLLRHDRIINSEHGSFYSAIVRYSKRKVKNDAVRRETKNFEERKKYLNSRIKAITEDLKDVTTTKSELSWLTNERARFETELAEDDKVLIEYLDADNTCISTAIDDIRYYMSRHNLPLSVLVGEHGNNKIEPHCVCIIFQKYNDLWEAIVKDPIPVSLTSVRTTTRNLLKGIGYVTVRVLGELATETQRESINCLGASLQSCARVLEGTYPACFSGGLAQMCFRSYDIVRVKYVNTSNSSWDYAVKRQPAHEIPETRPISEESAREFVDLKQFLTTFHTFINDEHKRHRTGLKAYHVKQILDRRVVEGALQYFIRWSGYSESEDSWEPLESLEQSKESVVEYELNYLASHPDKENGVTLRKVKPRWFTKRKAIDTTEYVVENIVARRVRQGRLEYRVQWLGYGPDDETWEDVDNLENSKDKVMDYETTLNQKRQKLKLFDVKPGWKALYEPE